MKILITGAAGFIGFNFCKYLLSKTEVHDVFGIDNMNNYYDTNLKKMRLKILKKYKKFKYYKIDINEQIKLEKIFKSHKFDFVLNLAAQAGVRYSIDHPRKYIDSNILGFYNIIENSKKYNVKRLFYASSSSVYGENNSFPLKESENINPKNIYGLSKKVNEEISQIFNRYYKLKCTGLRFFTVFGEWGRPDMMMMKYINAHFKKRSFQLNNFGKHTRDFTYILDACKIISRLIFSKKYFKNEIFNICSNNPQNLTEIIKKINSLTQKKPKIFKRKLQQADVVKTHGDNKKIKSFIGKQEFTSIDIGLKITVNWFKKYYKY